MGILRMKILVQNINFPFLHNLQQKQNVLTQWILCFNSLTFGLNLNLFKIEIWQIDLPIYQITGNATKKFYWNGFVRTAYSERNQG